MAVQCGAVQWHVYAVKVHETAAHGVSYHKEQTFCTERSVMLCILTLITTHMVILMRSIMSEPLLPLKCTS